MPILIEKTTISDLFIISNYQYKDDRGYLIKYFERDLYKEMGMATEFFESTDSMSNKGSLRGLVYQINPSQGRLIHVITGSIFNVALDLRPNSATFGKYECFYLSKDKTIFIPENFANGYLTLEDETIVNCQYTSKHIPENSNGIIWNDSELKIPWPLDSLDVPLIISEKDKKLQSFNLYKKNIQNG
jgi:dTDP-4-dehydrorhamnose 3,5-epimerase